MARRWRCWLGAGLALVLSACGGAGFEPAVTAVQPLSLQYGRMAIIQVGGIDLRSSMVADLGAGCVSPTFAASSTPTLAILNCTVKAVGELPLTLKSATGELLYQTTLSVPLPQVQLLTSQGNITLELDPIKAPVSVDNFLAYVRSGFYKDTLFHRVLSGFVVQGGGFTKGLQPKTDLREPIALESRNGLSNLRGAVAMARTTQADSATSQFFINLVDNLRLDYKDASNPGYAVFGKVVQGMDVADAMARQATATVGVNEGVPVTDITITQALQIR